MIKVVEVTYFDKVDNKEVSHKAVLIKETPKTIKIHTRNNEQFGLERTIKKENVISITEVSHDEALSFVNSCSDLTHYVNKLSNKQVINTSNKLALSNVLRKPDRTIFTYSNENYSLNIRAFKEGFIMADVTTLSKEEYIPTIYIDDEKMTVKIQTTSYGSLDAENINKVIAGYNKALELLPDIEFLLATYKTKSII